MVAEILKSRKHLKEEICQIIRGDSRKKETVPEEWSRPIKVIIAKKRENAECFNYKTTSLINHVTNISLNVTLNRIQANIESYQGEQARFSGSSEAQHNRHQLYKKTEEFVGHS